MRRTCSLVCLKPGHIAKNCHSSVKSSICERRLHTLLYLRKENPSSVKDKGNNTKKKTSWIRSELTIEEIQRAGFAVIDKVQSSESNEKIKWHFSSPSAPLHGGWGERMVRSIKQILRKCLGKAYMTLEVSQTKFELVDCCKYQLML
ncbi:hypothetical protein TNCT_122931 [Trichonephila clavata]|uniref:Uncharacterized protein n=1 Tax=Trichonephila clavata TaxID=2740835 RepID=A0A8X6FQN9_TRICU|nr:hypothetical protein TNCT_122931 [Trichonephila clavata]